MLGAGTGTVANRVPVLLARTVKYRFVARIALPIAAPNHVVTERLELSLGAFSYA
jgi:hypothetical protein